MQERRKSALEREYASLELEAIKAQINPHFIYNCLNSIQHSIIKSDTKGAEEQLSAFAGLVRETLDYSKLDFITLEQEISYLKKYLQMEKFRFKEQLKFSITSQVKNPGLIRFPSLLVQPYVENSIKYGKSVHGGGTTIKVDFSLVKDELRCIIEDGGAGIKKNDPGLPGIVSGMSLSSKRAETYNSIHNMEIRIKVINKGELKNDEQGTKVIISFPIVNP